MNKKYTHVLRDLVSEYPDLPIIAEVETEVVASDEFSYWYGEFANSRVDEYCLYQSEWAEEPWLILKEDGLDRVYDNIYDSIDWDSAYPDVDNDEQEEKIVIEHYEKLLWKKAIFVRICPWDMN